MAPTPSDIMSNPPGICCWAGWYCKSHEIHSYVVWHGHSLIIKMIALSIHVIINSSVASGICPACFNNIIVLFPNNLLLKNTILRKQTFRNHHDFRALHYTTTALLKITKGLTVSQITMQFWLLFDLNADTVDPSTCSQQGGIKGTALKQFTSNFHPSIINSA